MCDKNICGRPFPETVVAGLSTQKLTVVSNNISIIFSRMKILLLYCCLSLFYIYCWAQTDGAVDFGARCEPYNGDPVCKGALLNDGVSVYIASGWTQQTILTELKSTQFNLGLVCSNTTKEVAKLSQAFTCNQAFRPCVEMTLDGSVNGQTTVAIFQSQCYGNCMELQTSCQIAAFLDCKELYAKSTLQYYPPVSNTFPLSWYGGVNTTETCLDTSKIDNNGTVVPTKQCPGDLIYRNSTGEQRKIDEQNGYVFAGDDLKCVFPCPAPLFTDRQWKMFFDTITVTSIISFICTSTIIFTYLVLNRKYDRHAICIIFISFGLWTINLTDMMMIGGGRYNINCPEPGRGGVQSDVMCAVTGSIFQFGCVTAILWWSTMAFDLWLVLKRVRTQRSYEKYYMVILTLIAIFLTVLPAGQKKYSSTFGGLGCWIGENNYLNGVFWFPLTFCLLCGIVFIILILREVINEAQDSIEDQMGNWVRCLIRKEADPLVECSLNPIPFGGQFFFYFFVRFLGIELLIFYGINRRAKKIWMTSIFFHNRFYSITFSQSKTSMNSSTHTSQNVGSIKMNKGSRATFDEGSIEVSDVNPNNEDDSTFNKPRSETDEPAPATTAGVQDSYNNNNNNNNNSAVQDIEEGGGNYESEDSSSEYEDN
ncbi:G-protein-coupled receptor family protein [Heterostelium album PN500]|uniref:G-protein-coupled receptor family protein n=1 Tax=Heterostelium pallidum (strain ATCC 26659 / Pp 5 / PN500) TaxID=670386 RepID=D3BU13_HETP5|nr:G-protein-coupled receptor family protein [Heterostelium album PN500]EFA75199.1 G-protein-coupled receptor family protein [Heterostelium album PN500]|eukprot:XP_020427333.1 G-protein-coupled receptor family protein [Heterostelium album PN500]